MTAQELMGQAQAQGLKRLDLEVLGSHVLGQSRAHFLALARDPLSETDCRALKAAYQALAHGTPLQYLTHRAWFWGRAFYVDERVLIPRFDTEVLVREALDLAASGDRLLDLCTGSGIIPITLKAENPSLQLAASDVSPGALEVAAANARDHQVAIDLRQGDLFAPWQGQRFNVITANPPYISRRAYEGLSPQVLAEPKLALVGGDDGLALYRRIVAEAKGHLAEGGRLLVEIGWDQGPAVVALFQAAGFQEVRLEKDDQDLDRLVSGAISG